MCALDVRSPRKYHVDNTRRKVCDGASCAFIGLFGCVGCIRHLDGTSTCAAENGRRGLRRGPSGASDPSCRRVLHPNIHVSDGVFSTESCRYGGLRTRNGPGGSALGRGRAGAGGVDPIVINL